MIGVFTQPVPRAAQSAATTPTIDELISLKRAGDLAERTVDRVHRPRSELGREQLHKGFEGVGHGPSKPQSSRAVMQHNLEWFDKYIFNTTSTTTSQQER